MQGQDAKINGSEGCPSQEDMRSSYHQLDNQHLYSPTEQDTGSSQNMFAELPDRGNFRTPPLETFSNDGGVQNNYATVRQNYGSPTQEATSPWQSFPPSHQSSGDCGPWSPGVGSPSSAMQEIPPDAVGSPNSFGQRSMHSTGDSYDSSNTSYSRLSTSDCIDSELTQFDNPSKYPLPIVFTDAQQVSSPDQFTISNPSPFDHQRALPDQATGYPHLNQPGSYFDHNPNYSPYLVIYEPQQLDSGLQSQAYSSSNNGDFVPSLPPHYRPTPHDEEQDTAADGTSQESYSVCPDPKCGQTFKRPTDLVRHQETAKKHGSPKGPYCPGSDCKYSSRFTRTDNFKAHYMNKHGKTSEEADRFIKRWKDKGRR